ncbi:MAG: peptidase inhibitor family I36 protein [Actinophytocola sp.]|uniref:peptidase inhibitor family I36 protein n=1 Tax=Actinophytocola sp. TaxID=1872138 RepID=UPI003C757A8F
MTFMNGLRRKAVLAVAVAGLSSGFTTPALAAPAASVAAEACGETQFCMSRERDGIGETFRYESSADGTCISRSNAWSDGLTSDAKSFENNLTVDALVFTSGNCSGFPTGGKTAPKGSWNFEDDVRSFRILGADCVEGRICFWTNSNFTGTLKAKPWGNFCQDTGGIAAKTAWNRTGSSIDLYSGGTCLGASYVGSLPANQLAYTENSWGRWNLS